MGDDSESAAPLVMSVPAPGAGEPDLSLIPARHGVAVLEDADGRTILIGTSADARSFVRSRLTPPTTPSPRASHRDLTHRVLVWRAGSLFETEAIYLRVARQRLPETYRALTERWRGWFVHADPNAPTPRWTKSHLAHELPDPTQWANTLGPLPDKDAAGRYIETVIDAFDLCRVERLLLQTPDAEPCAYKEMGRCPAPCDGSEPMSGFRERTREAILRASGVAADRTDPARAAMAETAARHDYEAAAGWKARLTSLEALDRPRFRRVSTLDRFRWLIAAPAERTGWTRLFVCDLGTLRSVGEVRPETEDAALEALLAGARGTAAQSDEAERSDMIGLVCRWLFVPRTKRTVRFARLDEVSSASDLRGLIRARRGSEPPPTRDGEELDAR